jgi:hypothetical protein
MTHKSVAGRSEWEAPACAPWCLLSLPMLEAGTKRMESVGAPMQLARLDGNAQASYPAQSRGAVPDTDARAARINE